MTVTTTGTTRELASFLRNLRLEDLPREVVDRAGAFFLAWITATLAGRNVEPVRIPKRSADTMGPADRPSEILVSRHRASPAEIRRLIDGVWALDREPGVRCLLAGV